jgi:hypothetical protein
MLYLYLYRENNTMTDKTYNGWTNYATWRVNLEMFDCFDVAEFLGLDLDGLSQYDLGDAFKNYAENLIISETPYDGLAQDYALAFLSDVNWYEIASHKLEEVAA